MDTNHGLKAAQLYQRTDPEKFDFRTTADLEDLAEVIGQPRAVAAMQFGIGMPRDGYNIFALGPTGTAKRRFIRGYFERQAAEEPVPDDWCYVNNFDLQLVDALETECCGTLVLPARSEALKNSALVTLLENMDVPVMLVT